APEPEPDAVALIPNPNYSETFEISHTWGTKGEWYNVVEITIKNNSSSNIDLRNGVFLYESLTPATDHGFKNVNSISYPKNLSFQNYPTADSAVRQYRSLLTFEDASYVDSTIGANEFFTITIAFGQLSQEQYDKVTGSARFFSNNNLSPEFFAALRLKTPAKPEDAFATTKAFLKNTDLDQTETKTVTFGEDFVFSLLPNNNYELFFPEFSSPTHRYTANYTEAAPYKLLANNTGVVPQTTLSFSATAVTPASVTVDLRWMPVGMQADMDLYFDGSGNNYDASNITAAGKTLSVAPGSYRLAIDKLKETDDRSYYVRMLKNKFTFESGKSYTIGGITFPTQPPRVVPRWPSYLSMGTVGNGAVENDSALTAAPVDCFFVYAGKGGNGDRGEILDTPLRATTNTIAQARRIEAIQGKNILPVMVIYTAEYSGGNNENADFEDENLYMHYVNLIRQVITLQTNHDATHPHAGSIVLNPDCLGVLQQMNLTNLPPASGGTLGLTIKVNEQLARAIQYIVDNDKIDPVAVPDGLTDDLKGWIQSQNFIIRQFGPNITYGWQQNVWSTGDSYWVHTDSDAKIDSDISTPLVNFMTELGVYEGPWKPDFLVFDRYERDSFSKIGRFNGYAYSNLSWDRYFTHIEQVSKKMGDMPIMLWQIPGGHMPIIGEDTGAYDLIDHACSAAPYILGDDRIGTDLTKINPTVLNLTLPDPEKYGSEKPATVKALLETGAGYDWGTSHLQRLIDMNVFALLWGGGTTTSVGSIGTNGDDNGWLAAKVTEYYQAPYYLIKSIPPTVITHGSDSVSLDMVPIAKPWNAPVYQGDRSYGYVDREYKIGKYEITAAQFAAVLAADSRVGDGDESHWVTEGVGSADVAPAAQVSWLEAAKFCNWLTSGNAYTGAYQFDASGNFVKTDRQAAFATYSTLYVLPTDDEWYKAACYTGSGYSKYSFGSAILPLDGTDANSGSLQRAWQVGNGIPDHNKTHDLFGNLNEWIENSDAFEMLDNSLATKRLIAPSSYNGFTEDSFIPKTTQ
ncbi:MAG: SUMF1/EgtB/PvdO family nonheme iron enzyme, partial [Opitutales bacterium]